MATTAVSVPFDPSKLAVALKQTARDSGSGITSFLKMEKTGSWVHGIDAEEVEEGQVFMVDPRVFQHGYVAWEADNAGNKLGEHMAPVTEAVEPPGPVPDGADSWQFQLGLGLIRAEDGLPLLYRATSVGGKRIIGQIASEVAQHLGDKDCIAEVTLSSESYIHKKYGKIFNPIIEVVGWTSIAKMEAIAAAGKPAPAPEQKKVANGSAKKTAPAKSAPAKKVRR